MTFRIGSYNVRDLFVAGETGAPDVLLKSPASLKAVARVIDLMESDVLALQELGGQRALEALNALLREPFPIARCVTGNSDRGIHLGFLSRVPLTVKSHRTLPLDLSGPVALLKLQRDLLLARVASIGDEPLCWVANVHLKSKAQPRAAATIASDQIRAAELKLVLKQLEPLADGPVPALLVGDFNDNPTSDALRALTGTSWVDGVRRSRMLAGQGGRLPGTFWPRRRSRLDRLLLNPAAALKILPGSAETHVSTLAQRASDHYPVTIDLRLPDEPEGAAALRVRARSLR